MRRAALLSGGVHLAVIALVYFGLPSLFRPDPIEDGPVAVEVVTPDALAQPKTVPDTPPPKPTPPPTPPAAKPRAEPAPAPAVKPKPQPKPEPKPKPEAKPKPKPKPEAKPKPKPKPAPQAVAKAPPSAPKPKRKPEPPPDQFDTLLKNLAEEAKANRPRPQQTARAPEPSKPAPAPSMLSRMQSQRVAAQLANMVKSQVAPCWNVPAGARDARDLVIAIRIRLNPDGTLRGAPRIEDSARMRADGFYRAAAESAVRALQNPRCSPLRLPYDHYNLWQEITFNFDPREALGP